MRAMGGRFQRDLLRGSLDLMVLSTLSGGAKYGYLILQEIRDASRGRVDLKAGTIYPLLHRLEAAKLIRSRWDDSTGRNRKWYELTAAGVRRLQQQAQDWQSFADCIARLLDSVRVLTPKPTGLG
jgi:PadR family transcriptional regulator, regulatory protein PadR